MATYLDTGALVKLYVAERGSRRVQEIANEAASLVLCPLQLLETRTAIRAAAGRNVISREAMEKTLANLDDDLAAGCFALMVPDWAAVWEVAEALSAGHVAGVLARTLDLLHVAIALHLGVQAFVTGDKRQSALAREAGLPVVAI
jgi:predicted nucleic acid-binding protein